MILNIINNDNNYQLILLSEDDSNNIFIIKDIIKNEIKNAIEMEYFALKSYFKKLLDDEKIDINIEIK